MFESQIYLLRQERVSTTTVRILTEMKLKREEKVKAQGLRMLSILFIWLRCIEASSSVCPPDRN